MIHVEVLEETAEALVLRAGSFVDVHCTDEVDRGLAALNTTISRLEGFPAALFA